MAVHYRFLCCIACPYEPKVLLRMAIILDILLWIWPFIEATYMIIKLIAVSSPEITYTENGKTTVEKVSFWLYHMPTIVSIVFDVCLIWPFVQGILILVNLEKFITERTIEKMAENYVNARKLGLIIFGFGTLIVFIVFLISIYLMINDLFLIILVGILGGILVLFYTTIKLIFTCMWCCNNGPIREAAKILAAENHVQVEMAGGKQGDYTGHQQNAIARPGRF